MFTFKQFIGGLGTAALLSVGATASAALAPIYTQGFDGVTQGGPAAGLTVINRSTTPADQWGGGNGSIFGAQSGAPGSYFADSFEAGGGAGIVSDWLVLPVMNIANDYTFSFYTRADLDTGNFPDRLELRLCTGTACTNAATAVGSTPGGVGSFTNLLLSINPALAAGGFPTAWTQYVATVGGLGAGVVSGRFALRYFLDDVVTQGSYIGVDSIVVSAVPEPESMALLVLGLTAMGLSLRRKARR